MAQIVNIYVDQGSDYTLDVTVQGDDGANTNISTYTVDARLQKNYGSNKAWAFESTVMNAAQGAVRLKLPGSLTDDIDPGRYIYDMQITSASENVCRRVIEGTITLRPTANRKSATLLETGSKLLLEA